MVGLQEYYRHIPTSQKKVTSRGGARDLEGTFSVISPTKRQDTGGASNVSANSNEIVLTTSI